VSTTLDEMIVSETLRAAGCVLTAPGLPEPGTVEFARAYLWVTVSNAGYPTYARTETTWEKVAFRACVDGVERDVWGWRKVSERRR
jgi:hypothetical protein